MHAGLPPFSIKFWHLKTIKPMYDRANFITAFKKIQKYVLLLIPADIARDNCLDHVMEHVMGSTYDTILRDNQVPFIYNRFDLQLSRLAPAQRKITAVRGNDAIGQIATAMLDMQVRHSVFGDGVKSVANPPLPLPTAVCKQRAALLSMTSAWVEVNTLLALHSVAPLPQPVKRVAGSWTWVQFTEDPAADAAENRARAYKVAMALSFAIEDAHIPKRAALAKQVLQVCTHFVEFSLLPPHQ